MAALEDSGAARATPSTIADRLEELADSLSTRLAEAAGPAAVEAVRQHVEGLVHVASELRSMALLFDPNRADVLGKREEEVRSIALTISESIRGLAEVHRLFNEQMGGEIQELTDLAELPPGEELAVRLRRAVRHVGDATREMGRQVKAAAAKVGMANLQIVTLEHELNEAREQALHDGLTRLYSRSALDERLRAATAVGEAEGPWCFLIGDMDHFKRVNDQFGHVVGDTLLARVARFLEESLRREDEIGFIARYGGEEFGIILPRTSVREAANVGERIRGAMAEQRWTLGNGSAQRGIQVTISMGVAQYRDGDTPETLVQRADDALYRAKQKGRNRVVAAED